MYKLEIYDGVDFIENLFFIYGEENEIRDYIAKYELEGYECRLWEQKVL